MEKELTTLEVREKANLIAMNWDYYKKEIHLSPRSLYNLIAIKKQFEEQFATISDALISMFTSNECPVNEDGTGFKVPAEKQDIVNKFMEDFSKEKVKFNYEAIKLKDEDCIPADLIEVFFDFIVFE